MHNENTIITVAAVKSTATLIKGKLGGASVDLMLDSGSSVSLIQIDALKGACNVVQVSSARPIQLVRISCCSLFTNRFHMFSNADTSPSRSCQPTQNAPTFISQVMGDTEKEGGIAFYICSSTGGPVPTISWYFNDVPVDVTNTVKYDVLLTSPGQNIPPVIVQHPHSQLVEFHFDVSLVCDANGNDLKYQWTHNGNILASNSHYSIINDTNLVINNVKSSDSGQYQCFVSNSGGRVASNYATVLVVAKVPAPDIITHPTDTTVAAPFSAVFTCSVCVFGHLNLIWYKGSEIYESIPKKSVITVTSSNNVTNSTLTILNVSSKDSGMYYCEAWANKKASQSRSAHLLYSGVAIIPSVLSTSLVILKMNDTKLSLNCIPNERDFIYTWERKDSDLPSRAEGVHAAHMTVANLIPEDSGEYRCLMSNSTGTLKSKYFKVAIQVSLPIILNDPKSATVKIFASVMFKCTAEGYGHITITWRKVDHMLPLMATIKTTKSRGKISSVLKITRTAGFYSGQYYCVVKNEAGPVDSRYAKLHVQEPVPEIIGFPRNITVLPGGTTIFYCLALSYGSLVYDWKKVDGKDFPSTATKSFVYSNFIGRNTTVYKLAISNTQLSNEGKYCCIAQSEGGTITKCAWLNVNILPKFTKHPKSVTIRAGDVNKVAMSCKATGVGALQYHWEKYQPSSDSWMRPSRRAVDVTSRKLIFSVIEEEDEGIYHCVVTNDDGSVSSDNATINVYGLPNSSLHNQTMVIEGRKVRLICNITNDADAVNPKVNWYKENVLVKEDKDRVSIFDSMKTNHIIQSVLLFENVTHADGGRYICRAYNDPGFYTEASTLLIVEYAPVVSILPAKSLLRVKVGDQLSLYCRATGLPNPTLQWYEGSQPANSIEEQVLDIPTNFPHTTAYTCIANNTIGTTAVNITIIIEGVCPPSPEAPDDGEKSVIFENGIENNIKLFADDITLYKEIVSLDDHKLLQDDLTKIYELFKKWLLKLNPLNCFLGGQQIPLKSVVRYLEISINSQLKLDPANIITQPPVDVTVNQTFSVQFDCTSFGNPIPQIVWSRVGDDDLSDNTDIITVTTMVDSDMYTVTSSLVINSTERFRDQGVYNCTATNGVTNNVGAVNVEGAELVVQVPPLVMPMDRVVVGVENMSAVLSFIVNNSFPLITDDNVRWLLTRRKITTDITNNDTVDNNILTFQYNMTTQMYTLNISNIQPNYTSQFNLTVSNPAGVSTDFIIFIVEGPPEIIDPPVDTAEIDDNDVTLICTAIALPQYNITWMYQRMRSDVGRDIISTSSSDTNMKYLINNTVNSTNFGTLTITNLQYDDRGIYTCVAANEHGAVSADAMVNVHVKPTNLTILGGDRFNISSQVNLTCTAIGVPLPTIM
ncbi:hemicentin-1-like [Dysidea avara]|uniref:hemicentin-1-like n=1 Tax=Dysidea avara TaxID=196820 RepID=UPI00331CDD05